MQAMENTTQFNPQTLAACFDHTLLRADATPSQVEGLCQEALQLGCAAVCINPSYLPLAVRELEGSEVLPITVVGFPLGAVPASWKSEETRRAVDMGAREVDMVINPGLFIAGVEGARNLRDEVASVVQSAGEVPVKVIIETALLNPEQIKTAARVCAESGAAFVKTSTGFSTRGATVEDIQLIADGIRAAGAKSVLIKASGGIKTLDQAMALLRAGAHRIGSSGTVGIVREFKSRLQDGGRGA